MKIFFIDIDGTILPEGDLTVKNEVVNKISEMRNLGHKVFICTGRSYISALEVTSQMKFDGYILSNGQEVIIDDEVLYEEFFDKKLTLKILETVRTHSDLWAYENRNGLNVLKSIGSEELVSLIKGYGLVHCQEVEKMNTDEIFQLWAFGKADQVTAIANELPEESHYYQWSDTSLEITPTRLGKGKGVMEVCKYYSNQGVTNITSYGVGDGLNDLPMMEVVDVKIAMGNAKDELKVLATHITDDIQNDGLIKALDKFK